MIGLIDATGLDHDSDDEHESLGALQMEGARASDDFTSFSSIVDDVCCGFSDKTHDMVPLSRIRSRTLCRIRIRSRTL